MKSRPGIENHPLTQAARLIDDLSEIGFKSSIRQAGLDPGDLAYVAEQRALRFILTCVRTMSPDQLRAFKEKRTFELSDDEIKLLHMYTACEMDGIMIGWRGHQIKEEQT